MLGEVCMNKTVRKTLTITGIVVGAVVALFLLLYLVLAIIGCAMYGEARGARRYVCDVAGISEGIAPQGITYSKEKNVYLETGYGPDGTTLFYVVEEGKVRRVRLNDDKGETLKCHAGGVTCVNNCVYIANGAYLYLYDLNELYSADGQTAVALKRKFAVDNNAAYCFNDGEYLYVGEFYRAGNYETDKAHYYTTPNGDENKAIVSRYKLDGEGLLSADGVQPYPDMCISVTGLVQGFATQNGTFVLSRSYGLKNSDLEYHSAPKDSGTTITPKFKRNEQAESREVPLYYLDSATNFKTLVLPAFSEDLTIVDGRVVVTNEASANKYFVGKLFGSHKVYSYPLYTEQ